MPEAADVVHIAGVLVRVAPEARDIRRRLAQQAGVELVLPSAMIFEKWGAYGNSERRTQMWRRQVGAPRDARSDLWQILEFSKRLTIRDLWGAQPVAGAVVTGEPAGRLPDVRAAARALGHRPNGVGPEEDLRLAGALHDGLDRSSTKASSGSRPVVFREGRAGLEVETRRCELGDDVTLRQKTLRVAV